MTERRKITDDDEVVKHDEPMHVRLRPRKLGDVIGQAVVIKSLKDVLTRKARPHAFLFIGQPGIGKTTLARIVATECRCAPENIIEVDAASNSGIDAMRELTASLKYQGFGVSPNKMIIIDEAQGLSKQAWDSLLKTLEEPPEHVFFALCTTVGSKIPKSIESRCVAYTLQPVDRKTLFNYLDAVCDGEGFKTSDAVLDVVIEAANGSPRQALQNLAKVADVSDAQDAERLLQQQGEDAEVIDLVRLAVKGSLSWDKLQETLKAMPEPNAEGIRIVMSCYIAKCMMTARGRELMDLLAIAYDFRMPFNPTDKLMPLFLAFERVIERR